MSEDKIAEEYKFGNQLRSYRVRATLTQQELADAIRVSRNTIIAWEQNKYPPKKEEHMDKIEIVLNLSKEETDKLRASTGKFPSKYNTPNLDLLMFGESLRPITVAFSFGPYEVPYIILEGNGETAYRPENITIRYDRNNVLKLPRNLEEIKKVVEEEVEEKKLRGEKPPWNGGITFLERWNRIRTASFEELGLELWFGHTDYFTFLATNMSLHTRKIFDPKTGRDQLLYDTYFAGYNWSNPSLEPRPFFSNIFGVVVCLVTSDNKIIIGKRPQNIGGHAGVLNIGINESVLPEKDLKGNNLVDIYHTASRGTKEELGFHLKDIKFFAFGVDSYGSMWNLLGVAHTDLTADEVILSRFLNAIDKFETDAIYKVDFKHPRSMIEFVDLAIPSDKRHSVLEVWSPGALACIYYTLVNKFGTDRVNREIAFYFGQKKWN